MSNHPTKKTNRKNKTNLKINWSNVKDTFFTLEQLLAENSNFIEITLRSHVNAAKRENIIDDIGCIHNGKGRPKLVMAMTPVTQKVLEAARNAGVLFNERYDSVAVVDVNAVPNTTHDADIISTEEHTDTTNTVDIPTDINDQEMVADTTNG